MEGNKRIVGHRHKKVGDTKRGGSERHKDRSREEERKKKRNNLIKSMMKKESQK
jgi:hypothetical protein